jgi:hypothetical protein
MTGYTVTSVPEGHQVTVSRYEQRALVPGLTDGIEYTFVVTAKNNVGESMASKASNAVIPDSPPRAPTSVAATAGVSSAQVTWTAPADADVTSYTVASSPGGRAVTITAPANRAKVTGLTNGIAYTFTVTARNATGAGPASTPSASVTPAGKPAAIAQPTATVRRHQATLRWKSPSAHGSPITSYVVKVSNGVTKTVAGNKTRLILKSLKPGKYSFRIAAANAVGMSKLSPRVTVRIR